MTPEKLTPEQIVFRLGRFRALLDSYYDDFKNPDEESKQICEANQDVIAGITHDFDTIFNNLE